MILNEVLDDDTILFYLEAYQTHFNDKHIEVIDTYLLAFGFFDCHYDVLVTKEDIALGIPFTKIVGDPALFQLFLAKCVEDLLDIIIKKCIFFDLWYASIYN